MSFVFGRPAKKKGSKGAAKAEELRDEVLRCLREDMAALVQGELARRAEEIEADSRRGPARERGAVGAG